MLVPPFLPSGLLSGRPQPQLVGRAVTLRSWSESDAATLVTAYQDPDIQRWHCRSLDADETVALIRQWRAAWDAGTGASWAT
jgi:hypothetical protein